MKRTLSLLIVAMLATAAIAAAQEEGEDKAMEMMMKLATPGEHHGHLAMLAGEYTYKAKAFMQPGQPPMEWTGERSAKMVLGGRYLQETVSGTFMGQPFKGMGYMAYDNASEQYIHVWFDNMATGFTTSHGTCSKDGWAMSGEHFNPMFNQKTGFRMVLAPKDNGDFVFEWYEEMPDGSEQKTMEISYTKKG